MQSTWRGKFKQILISISCNRNEPLTEGANGLVIPPGNTATCVVETGYGDGLKLLSQE